MKTLRLIAAAMALVLAAGAPIVAQSRGAASIAGTVKTESGEPVADGIVNFLLPSGGVVQGKTDADGTWRVTGLGKGEWRVMFVAKGYVTKVMKVVVEVEKPNADLQPVTLKKATS
jgi:hypothetical protein